MSTLQNEDTARVIMNKHLIVIGISVLLIYVGLSEYISDKATVKIKEEGYIKSRTN